MITAFPLNEYYCPPKEILTIEVNRVQRGHFNLIHISSGYKADVYLYNNDGLHEWGLKNKKSIHVDDYDVRLAPIEYVILRKLEYYRESGHQKHLLDIEAMLRVKENDLSSSLLLEWIQKLSLMKEWESVKRNKSSSPM